MEKRTYTPSEFASVFGKERTWAYRQLYAGKVKAITKLGQIQIPHSEVEKLLNGAERYRGSPSHAKRVAKRKAAKEKPVSKGANKWKAAVTQRKKHGPPPAKSARSVGGRKPSLPKSRRPGGPATGKPSERQRQIQYKWLRKGAADHDGKEPEP